MIGRAADFFTTETVTQLRSANERAMSGPRVGSTPGTSGPTAGASPSR